MTPTNGTTNERNVTELSGFTPGPWIVQSQGPMCSIYVMQDDGNKYPFVAHVQTSDLARDWQTQERIGIANAQLIAAAPQMHADLARLRAENERLRRALEGIFAQTAKHSRQWGQAASAHAFARDPDTATAFAAARAALKGE